MILLLGSNVPTTGGIEKGFKFAKLWKCECIQIYLTLSRRWQISDLSINKIENFKKEQKDSNILEIVAHIPFLVNLASPDKNIRDKSIERIIIEINRAEDLGVKNLVLHPGSYTQSDNLQGIIRIIDGLNEVFNVFNQRSTPNLVLETMAGQGTSIGGS